MEQQQFSSFVGEMVKIAAGEATVAQGAKTTAEGVKNFLMRNNRRNLKRLGLVGAGVVGGHYLTKAYDRAKLLAQMNAQMGRR